MDDSLILRRLAQLAQTADEAAAAAEHDAAALRQAVRASTEALRSTTRFLSHDIEQSVSCMRSVPARGRSAGPAGSMYAAGKSRPAAVSGELPSALLDLEHELCRISSATAALEHFVAREDPSVESPAESSSSRGLMGAGRGPGSGSDHRDWHLRFDHPLSMSGSVVHAAPSRVSEAELASARKLAQLQAAYASSPASLSGSFGLLSRPPFVLPARIGAGSMTSLPSTSRKLAAEARSAEESVARRAAAVRQYAERQVALVASAWQAQTRARARLFETLRQRVLELLHTDTKQRLASACTSSRGRWSAALKRAALDAIAQVSLWVDQAEALGDSEAAALLEQAQIDFNAASESFKGDAIAAARRDCAAALQAQEAGLRRQHDAATAAAIRAVEVEAQAQLDTQLATGNARNRAELDRTVTTLRQRLTAEADAALAAAGARAAADRTRVLQEAEAAARVELARREETEVSRFEAQVQAEVQHMQQAAAEQAAERLQEKVRDHHDASDSSSSCVIRVILMIRSHHDRLPVRLPVPVPVRDAAAAVPCMICLTPMTSRSESLQTQAAPVTLTGRLT